MVGSLASLASLLYRYIYKLLVDVHLLSKRRSVVRYERNSRKESAKWVKIQAIEMYYALQITFKHFHSCLD